jgi:hypothetical protein
MKDFTRLTAYSKLRHDRQRASIIFNDVISGVSLKGEPCDFIRNHRPSDESPCKLNAGKLNDAFTQPERAEHIWIV